MKTAPRPQSQSVKALDNLTQSAQAELEQQERIIAKGLDSWYEVGKAFETITQRKLFGVAGYKSFKAYCKERWAKTDSAIFLYINAAQVRDEICEYVDIPPGNMSLYKELHKLPSLEDKVAVWDKVITTRKKPSVKALRAAVNKHLGNTPKPRNTTTLKVTVEAAELIKASAKQANMTTQDLISKLLAKVLE